MEISTALLEMEDDPVKRCIQNDGLGPRAFDNDEVIDLMNAMKNGPGPAAREFMSAMRRWRGMPIDVMLQFTSLSNFL